MRCQSTQVGTWLRFPLCFTPQEQRGFLTTRHTGLVVRVPPLTLLMVLAVQNRAGLFVSRVLQRLNVSFKVKPVVTLSANSSYSVGRRNICCEHLVQGHVRSNTCL